MNENIWLLLISLCIWRLSSIIARESGPLWIFDRIRGNIYNIANSKKNKLLLSLYSGIECIWCNSVWLSLVGSLLIANNVVEYIVYTFAISAIVILIESVVKYGES